MASTALAAPAAGGSLDGHADPLGADHERGVAAGLDVGRRPGADRRRRAEGVARVELAAARAPVTRHGHRLAWPMKPATNTVAGWS